MCRPLQWLWLFCQLPSYSMHNKSDKNFKLSFMHPVCDSYLCLVKKTSCLSVQLKRISQSWKQAIQSQFYSLNKSDLKNILANIYYFGQIPDRKMLMRLWKVQNLRHLFFPLIFSTAKTWVKNHRMVLDTSNKIPNHYGNPDQQSDLNSIHGEKNETMSIYPA